MRIITEKSEISAQKAKEYQKAERLPVIYVAPMCNIRNKQIPQPHYDEGNHRTQGYPYEESRCTV
jgi:hypothetical protein